MWYSQVSNIHFNIYIGETSTFSILIDFKESQSSEELANQLFGQLDNYSVELDGADRPSSGLGLHKMRSVESITSQSGDQHDDPSNLPTRSPAVFVNNTRIIIPITAKIDSEASFEKAHALLKFNIYEERADETLQKYLDEPRAGSRLLRKLLQDEPLIQSSSIVELVKSVNVRVPLYRPLQASINYVKKSDCAMLISVQLSCNEILQETFTIHELRMSLGDPSSHSTTNNGFDKQIFRVNELAVPLPVDMQAGEVYGCVFEVTLLPYAELRLKDEHHKEMKVHLDATITLTGRPTPLKVSFESEVNISKLLPIPAMKNLTVTFSCTFNCISP